MGCLQPVLAYRSRTGEIKIGKELPDSSALQLHCGKCLGCRAANAKAWALRCHLELQQHRSAVFTTLTYDEENRPPTLTKRHLQLFLKRFRKAMGANRPVRFFASGEYGETTNRPHYHAILYGPGMGDKKEIERSWGHGYADVQPISAQRIAYCAGYVQKKLSPWQGSTEYVDQWGELHTWQPPFALMSRRPGIGGHARKWVNSWRIHAIYNGQRLPVPRFLHNAWKAIATDEEIENLIYEKSLIRQQQYGGDSIPPGPPGHFLLSAEKLLHPATPEQLQQHRTRRAEESLKQKQRNQLHLDYQREAQQKNFEKKQELRASRRKYG